MQLHHELGRPHRGCVLLLVIFPNSSTVMLIQVGKVITPNFRSARAHVQQAPTLSLVPAEMFIASNMQLIHVLTNLNTFSAPYPLTTWPS